MRRRPGRTALALVLPMLLFIAFGMSRVTAPVSAIGALFGEPLGFAVAAAAVALVGRCCSFCVPSSCAWRPCLGRLAAPGAGRGRAAGAPPWGGDKPAGVRTSRLIVRVIEPGGATPRRAPAICCS